jgi:ATP-binding cassette, subfamily B (MDR/TAP), member 1
LEVASRSRTTVCIAHRLSTIKNADNIIVISQGRVVQQGTHDELYAQDGMYRGLVDAQRISAEGTGDGGDETPEEITEMELVRNHSRSQSFPQGEVPGLLRRSTTGKSSIIQSKDLELGVVEKKKYSLFYLLKKVYLSKFNPNSGAYIQQPGTRHSFDWLVINSYNRFGIPGNGFTFRIWY